MKPAAPLATLFGRLARGRGPFFLTGVVITLCMAALYVLRPTWLQFQELKLYDVTLRKQRPTIHSGLPVVVDLDEKSLTAYGQWPWPRFRVALLLARLKAAGVLAVGLDIVFAESDRTSPETMRRMFREELKLDVSFDGLPNALGDYDSVLAGVLRDGPFVLGYYLDFSPGAAPDRLAATGCDIPGLKASVILAPGAKPAATHLPNAPAVVCPLPGLLAAAPGAGFFNTIPDPDNIVRRSPILLAQGETICPSLSLATIMVALGVKNAVLRVGDGGVESLALPLSDGRKLTIPLDGRGRVLVNYRGPGGAFPHISAADVLTGSADPEALRGKIAYLGASAAGLRDLRATPTDRAMPGVEVHATLTDMIVTGDFLLRPDWAPGLEFCSILAVGLASAALLAWTRAVLLLVPFLGLGLGMWFGSSQALLRHNFVISPITPLLTLAANFMVLTFLKFWREESQKRFIHSAFSHYLSPVVVNELVASPDRLTLTGEEREVTVLFSDVRGFTSMSEKLTPTQVVDLLHRYLTPMTGIITSHLGTLDKFIGDAIMAFWNAPVAVPGHQAKALAAAMAMLPELDRLNQGFLETYGLRIDIGVGLHAGKARVGNFGSEDLFDYTVIGDTVNLCSRLEGLTKYYHKRILVTDSIVAAAPEGVFFQEVDRVLVKGKVEPVTIFAPLGPEEHAARERELREAAAALALYRDGRFAEALAVYEALAAAYPDPVHAIQAGRCRTLAATPPPGQWDGVFEHTSK
ncbi:CHASE2 domain-containing protein [Desulfolutivibrio sulfoxidireducens]|uniref:CHASE2 domain-containing protein n=1 Tax=Desulfolutivibrio sulfoxidireducens TaxID=2773299 RepID=UPI00159D26CC|nr:adenylate/guanylate cyclase domain-containing protein [Desulfolutivibrio sulfoxidireducens]QLA17216.1 CHASE2 domain-containing protein [Desulfolutivibrio sulfoxidireducens]